MCGCMYYPSQKRTNGCSQGDDEARPPSCPLLFYGDVVKVDRQRAYTTWNVGASPTITANGGLANGNAKGERVRQGVRIPKPPQFKSLSSVGGARLSYHLVTCYLNYSLSASYLILLDVIFSLRMTVRDALKV